MKRELAARGFTDQMLYNNDEAWFVYDLYEEVFMADPDHEHDPHLRPQASRGPVPRRSPTSASDLSPSLRSVSRSSVGHEQVKGAVTASHSFITGLVESRTAEQTCEVVDRAEHETVRGERHRGHRRWIPHTDDDPPSRT